MNSTYNHTLVTAAWHRRGASGPHADCGPSDAPNVERTWIWRETRPPRVLRTPQDLYAWIYVPTPLTTDLYAFRRTSTKSVDPLRLRTQAHRDGFVDSDNTFQFHEINEQSIRWQ